VSLWQKNPTLFVSCWRLWLKAPGIPVEVLLVLLVLNPTHVCGIAGLPRSETLPVLCVVAGLEPSTCVNVCVTAELLWGTAGAQCVHVA
jgi:hypothetical protein